VDVNKANRDGELQNGRREVQIPSWWRGANGSSSWELEKGARIEEPGSRRRTTGSTRLRLPGGGQGDAGRREEFGEGYKKDRNATSGCQTTGSTRLRRQG